MCLRAQQRVKLWDWMTGVLIINTLKLQKTHVFLQVYAIG